MLQPLNMPSANDTAITTAIGWVTYQFRNVTVVSCWFWMAKATAAPANTARNKKHRKRMVKPSPVRPGIQYQATL